MPKEQCIRTIIYHQQLSRISSYEAKWFAALRAHFKTGHGFVITAVAEFWHHGHPRLHKTITITTQ